RLPRQPARRIIMTTYRVTATTSVFTDVFAKDAFDSDSPGADALIVDRDAFLVATGAFNVLGAGADLAKTGAWRVIVNGAIVSHYATGLWLEPGNAAVSAITVGAEGSISGQWALVADSAVNIQNAGSITGTDYAMLLAGAGAHTVANSGLIEGQVAIYDS